MTSVFAVIQVLLVFALVGLILMHSGPRCRHGRHGLHTGLPGGTHIVERNLTRSRS